MVLKIKNYIMRHISAVFTGLLILSMLIITFWMIQSISLKTDDIAHIGTCDRADSLAAIATGDSWGEQYIVKEYDGRIGVYVTGDTVPSRVIQVYVAYLPDTDRVKLKGGILVSGRLELEKILDDFRS